MPSLVSCDIEHAFFVQAAQIFVLPFYGSGPFLHPIREPGKDPLILQRVDNDEYYLVPSACGLN